MNAHEVEQVKRIVEMVLADRQSVRRGIISAYDPNTFTARARIMPEDNETGWMQIGTLLAGNGFGVAFAPNIGDDCEIKFENGDYGNGSISPFFYTDDALPPGPVQAGEMWMVQNSGSRLVMTNDGDITANAARDLNLMAGRDINLTAGGSINGEATQDIVLTSDSGMVHITAATMTADVANSTFNGNVIIDGLASMWGLAVLGGTGITAAHISIPIISTSDITASGTITGVTDVIAVNKSGATHTHNYSGGGGTTDPPNP